MSTAITRRDLLVELGTEELPPKALRSLERAFAEGLVSRLTQAGLQPGRSESYATPRRLAVLVRRLAIQQPDQLIKRRGPPLSASFDGAGAPTRAATAFAASCGVPLEQLGREHDPKGNQYLSFEGVKAGASTAALLPDCVQQVLDALPIPKRMRWGSLDAEFVRPVHWLVILLGNEIVPAKLFGIDSGRMTRGHRFMVDRQLRLASPAGYERLLRTRGKVMARFQDRVDSVRSQVEALATQLGGSAILSEALLDEVAALVEWPVALAGQFEARFLALPREVLIATLQEHQRYFAVESAGALLPVFITVCNIESPQPQLVRAGNERVVRPRLADAAFFWEQDRRQPLAARRPGLDSVTFQVQLGSVGARARRIQALALTLAGLVGADADAAERAAQLCKCDLLTAMVGEFPELQGIMGRYYARADGETALVADTIAEHYLPRGAGDALPSSRVGDVVALADKLDTLAGIFAIGQKPTGTRDPFGLRRAAIGILRIILEHRLEFSLQTLLEQALRLQPLADIEPRAAAVADQIHDYIAERLRAQYLEQSASSGISTEMFDAVRAARPASVLDFDARLRALVAFLGRSEGVSLAQANKRIANILKKSDTGAAGAVTVQSALLRLPAEVALHTAIEALRPQVAAAVSARDYARALDQLASLRPAVDGFFEHVMVNDADAALRRNRLALVADLRAQFNAIADLSCLPG